jgi:ABC-type dipeptide/oligopeptide/nickel transport system ATPase component
MSDYQTVKEVRARANYLIEMIADFENQKANGDLSEKALYRENEARVELQGCQKYLDEVTTIHNKIRYFTHSESKMEKAAKEAVRRAIDELKGRYPNEAALIESGITIRGMWMELR